jgi:hypothetical protein
VTRSQAEKRVKTRKYMGDDQYSHALFVDGQVTYSGMDQSEARWRRKKAINNLVEGRHWDRDA